MLHFNKIILHNFGSYGHTEVDLNNKGFCLVTGKNSYKKDNALSNGSGKSFLWSGICFALTGETISGLTKNLKNINIEDDNSCYVTLEFLSGRDNFIITRIVEPKSDLKIIKNDVDISGKGIRESEKRLGELLPDLTKDLIASTLILGQGMPNKFSSFSPSGRKDLLEKLTKSDFMIEDIKNRVSERLLILNNQAKETDDVLLVLNTQINTNKTNLASVEKSLKERKEVNYSDEISEQEQQFTKITNDINETNSAINKIDSEIEAINGILLAKTTEKANLLTEESSNYNKKFTELSLERSQIQNKINMLIKEINKLKNITDKCPTCGQTLAGIVKPSIEKEESELNTLNLDLEKISEQLNECNTKHSEYMTQINSSFESDLTELNNRLTYLKHDLILYKNNSSDYTHYLNICSEKLTALKANFANHEAAIKELEAKQFEIIKNLEDFTTDFNEKLELKTELSKHLAVIKKMETLIKRDFRGYLLTNIIKYIDKKAKDCCEIVFGTRDLNVYVDGNALDISYCGKMIESLSGGERTRVDLILQFAIRDMLNSYLNMSSNILVLDEITDFLDKQSCNAVMKLIEKELNTIESVFIVSHHADELSLPIDSELTIIKNEFGISEVC